MQKKTYLTEEGYQELKERLEYLINVRRPKNIKDLQEARALGDLSENAEYHAAREEQSLLETEIKTIEIQLSNAEIIKKKDNGKVGLGSKVTIEYLDDDETDEYMIVGSREADPISSKISNESIKEKLSHIEEYYRNQVNYLNYANKAGCIKTEGLDNECLDRLGSDAQNHANYLEVATKITDFDITIRSNFQDLLVNIDNLIKGLYKEKIITWISKHEDKK